MKTLTNENTKLNLEKPIKKKRGRPSKKTEGQLTESVEKVPKKRGRKPKAIKEEPPKIPKKRGRKPKLNNVEYNLTQNKKIEDNIILHLPLVNIDNNDKIAHKLQYDPKINIPQPNDNLNTNYKMLDNNCKFDENNFLENLNIKYEVNKSNKELQSQLPIKSQNVNKYVETKYNLNHTKNTNYENLNKRKLYCFWDSHSFEGQIYGLPIKRENGEIYIFGTFCCPECVAAYNFNVLNDHNVWERYSIICEMYGDGEPIKIACSKLLLEKYGGNYSIDEYRNINSNNKVSYNIVLPPLISYIPTLEEIILDVNYNHVVLNKNKLKNLSDKYKIQKSKTLLNKNSLEKTMNLKYI